MKNYKIQTVQEYKQQKEDRNNIILQMRKEGHTYLSIAKKFGYSREWVRRILKEQLGTTKNLNMIIRSIANQMNILRKI